MSSRQFYTLKLDSKQIKDSKYHIKLDFEKAKKKNMIVGISDGQMLRLIRRLTGREVDLDYVDELYKRRKKITKLKNSSENSKMIYEIKKEIDDILFIPEYVTVVMKSVKQYEKIYKDGFYITIEGKKKTL